MAVLDEVITTGHHEAETVIQAKDGTRKTLVVFTNMIKHKEHDMFLSVYRDITERKLMDDKLKISRERLEIQSWGLAKANEGIKFLYKELEEKAREISKLAKAKSAFTSMVSHELRTPLAALKEGVSQVLEGMLGPINENQGKFLGIAKRKTKRARLLFFGIG